MMSHGWSVDERQYSVMAPVWALSTMVRWFAGNRPGARRRSLDSARVTHHFGAVLLRGMVVPPSGLKAKNGGVVSASSTAAAVTSGVWPSSVE